MYWEILLLQLKRGEDSNPSNVRLSHVLVNMTDKQQGDIDDEIAMSSKLISAE